MTAPAVTNHRAPNGKEVGEGSWPGSEHPTYAASRPFSSGRPGGRRDQRWRVSGAVSTDTLELRGGTAADA